ncbi:hypothetical protein I1A62_22575 [Rhodococcus sp. USK10]|uniref:Small uncharacterized protein Bpro_4170 n=1 Tax=Rhodococcus wratislaviensis TaxID=44752 RepID=A0A402CEX7_RHOWR|nr:MULTISPECIES: hypothetical protein [Rhodococcus]QYB07064.1 hypothetical protein I1A62_22575 [Rhodococcus sp. USK10]GCE42181.1 Small uncharacterized protein Bpro_4170 [Rhodococcus wratislaviensis]
MPDINKVVDDEIALHRIAQARSGDKNDVSDITVFLATAELFEHVEPLLTRERVAEHMAPLATGRIDRYVLPTVWGVKFVLHDALGGGGSSSLRGDNLGKSMAAALLQMTVPGVPAEIAQASHTYNGPKDSSR